MVGGHWEGVCVGLGGGGGAAYLKTLSGVGGGVGGGALSL